MSEIIIRTDKHVTISEAHPYHRYISDNRAQGGNALVEKAFDPRCPLCREEEDRRLLRYAGLLGHEFVGLAGDPGQQGLQRRLCEHK